MATEAKKSVIPTGKRIFSVMDGKFQGIHEAWIPASVASSYLSAALPPFLAVVPAGMTAVKTVAPSY